MSRHLEAVRRYNAKNPEKVKARWKAYREANRERLLSYQKEYRQRFKAEVSPEKKEAMRVWRSEYNRAYYSNTTRPKRAMVVKPKPIQVPRNPRMLEIPITKIISMYVSCSFCESKFRRGTPEYYDGSFDHGEFCCGQCSENLELEA